MPTLSLTRRARSWSKTTLSLPQISTPLAVAAHQSSGGHPFGLIHAQHTGHYTVLLSTTVDLAEWARLLTYPILDVGAHATDVVSITAVTETFPDTTDSYRSWAHVPDSTSEVPAPRDHTTTVDDIAVRAHLAITFAAATTDTRRFVEEMGVEVGRRLPILIGSLAAAGIPTTPLTVTQITELISSGYREDNSDDIAFADAAPVSAVHRSRSLFCHDDFASQSWTIARHILDDTAIATLLAPSPELPRRRVAVCWRAIRIADELPVDDPTHLTFVPQLHRMGGVVTVTEPHRRVPSIEPIRAQLPLYARLGLRAGYDRQAELFAESLGIGVLLPEHSELTDEPLRHRHRS